MINEFSFIEKIMEKKILNEVKALIDNDKKTKSFVVFNLSKKDQVQLYNAINNEFSSLLKELESRRQDEIFSMLEKDNWVDEKYSALIERYQDSDRLDYVLSIAEEAHKEYFDLIIGQDTKLKEVLKHFRLEEIDIDDYNHKDLMFNKLNDEMDFSNLIYCDTNKEFARNYILTEKEKEYRELQNYFFKKRLPKYIYCYNQDYHSDLDKLFRSRFKWDRLRWSLFAFSISKEQFEEKATDFVKNEMYYNREVLEL